MTPDRDARLAELLDRLAADQQAGRPPAIDGLAAAHPDLAAELRDLWAVAQVAHLVRVPARDSRATGSYPAGSARLTPTAAGTDPSLPRGFGDFELIEELGRGGMGVVYKARQKSLDRLVAVKMVREAHLATADDRARFRTEAEAAARLKHPNIVTVYEVGTTDGQAYICMEYVGGRRSPAGWPTTARCRRGRPPGWSRSSPGPCSTPTRKAFCTEI